jgi:hypothetical protein
MEAVDHLARQVPEVGAGAAPEIERATGREPGRGQGTALDEPDELGSRRTVPRGAEAVEEVVERSSHRASDGSGAFAAARLVREARMPDQATTTSGTSARV